jgi:hypothetical protein
MAGAPRVEAVLPTILIALASCAFRSAASGE